MRNPYDTVKMNPSRVQRALLLYLVLLGSIPFFDSLSHSQSPEGFHPRHNLQLGWKLIHIGPALGGIGAGLILMRRSSLLAFPAIAALALQIALAMADYRRIGFNSSLSPDLPWAHYLLAGAIFAPPFALYCWYRERMAAHRNQFHEQSC